MEEELMAKRAEELMNLLRDLTPEERIELLSTVRDVYCTDCGWPQPEPGRGSCECRNDE